MERRWLAINGSACGSCMVMLMAMAGCASSPATPSAGVAGRDPSVPLNRPGGVTQDVQFVAGVLPLGSVPYDNLALPLLSPDGRFAAVQTGAPPTWPTMLAEPSAPVPVATRIEVYEFDLRDGIKPQDRKAPALIAALMEPVVLGRSSDAGGFLVESAREDGSRWIGKATWTSGAIVWLVTGSEVNAFATLSSTGSLAWSRRTVEGDQFELVIRQKQSDGSDHEWTLATPGGDWLLPTWSETGPRGATLFALHLEAGNLELRYFMANSSAAAHQSMQRLSLSSESDVHTAYQTVSGQTSAVAAQPSPIGGDQIVFFHPAMRRMALWRPLAMADRQRMHLNARSIAALVDQEDYAFVVTTGGGGHLIRQNLRKTDERLNLVAGLQIPRQTTSAAWPYMLLNPGEGQIGVTAMRLLPREESIFSTR